MEGPGARVRGLATDFLIALAFSTRLPAARTLAIGGTELARASWALPLVGALVGLCGAAVYLVAHIACLQRLPGAALALAATILLTGCLHEDGLADTADGFGGGASREPKLEIMRDSRIGTYGVCALAVFLLVRASALASVAQPVHAALALVAAHAAARALLPAFMWVVPAARRDGLAADAGAPPTTSVVAAGLIGAVALGLGLGPARGAAALVLLGVTFALMARLTIRQIGGQTGDVLGALEQAGEAVVLLCAAAAR